MNEYLNKAEYNFHFLEKLEEDYPYDFWDWKAVVCFYVAIHCLNALAELQGQALGKNHKDIWKNLRENPDIHIEENIVKKYGMLFNKSRTSRYDGFLSQENFDRLQEQDYKDSRRYLNIIVRHTQSKCKEANVTHSFII